MSERATYEEADGDSDGEDGAYEDDALEAGDG